MNQIMTDMLTASELDLLWESTWQEEKRLHGAFTGQKEALWRVAGRATKDNPDRENEKWWLANGRNMLDLWINFRKNLGWSVWSTEIEGFTVPAIELTIKPEFAGVPVQMGIDRVMVTPEGELVVIDIKTGSRTPSSELQLAFYAAGMSKALGIRPKYGAYWMGRQGSTSTLVDLDFYTDDMIEEIVSKFDTARKSDIFLPNYSHCNMCGFKEKCKWNKEGK